MTKSLSKIYIHIIFSTKNRKLYFQEKTIRNRLYQYINIICENHQCHLFASGGIGDHIHLLVSLNKKISISKLIEEIKSSSSKWIKSIDIQFHDFYWQSGYGAFSVSQSSLDVVMKYINNQESHHKKYSFKEELETLLKAYKIDYDKTYLWS